VSISAVKSALEEAKGDEEKAIDILRKRGVAQAVKKSDREQKEGSMFLERSGNKAALVHLACETDFVARGDDFQNAGKALAKTAIAKGTDAAKAEAASVMPALVSKLGENITLADVVVLEGATLGTYVHSNAKIGVMVTLDPSTRQNDSVGLASSGQVPSEEIAKDVAMHAAAMAPKVVSPDQVGSDAVEKEKEVWREALKREGKPEAMWDKIMIGKEKKFREESALIKQPFVKDATKTVEQHLGGAKITGYVRLSVT
jgi:elongation factor Ts